MTRTQTRDLPIQIQVCYYLDKSAGFKHIDQSNFQNNIKAYIIDNMYKRLDIPVWGQNI